METVASLLQVLCYLVIAHAWTCTVPPQQHPAKQIDAGQGMVIMTDKKNGAYTLSGSTWRTLGTVPLKHVSAGPQGIWGVDASNKVYKYVAGDFVPSEGRSMQQVDAGGLGVLVGISPTSSKNIFLLTSTEALAFSHTSFLNWVLVSGSLIYISCGPYGCWGTNSANNIYLTKKIAPSTSGDSGWVQIEGWAMMVEVGTDGSVFVLNAKGEIFQRTGISSAGPQGTGWIHIPMGAKIKHLTYDLGQLWAITDGGVILKCTQ
ncbi:fish-egg lectin-like [Betta splendens]|uniref:Fish-egg lectin-like n=1 Tax=Betta splendens TaxID=158456 RepID=A0A6P7NA61_BETSP|nr:fish-egg lectin-like [Betta splendens]